MVEELRRLRELFDVPTRLLVTADASKDYEKVDPIPKEAAHPWARPATLEEMVREQVETALGDAAQGEGYESWSEANDFEEEEPDLLPMTEYELGDGQIGLESSALFDQSPPPVIVPGSGERSEQDAEGVGGSEATVTAPPRGAMGGGAEGPVNEGESGEPAG